MTKTVEEVRRAAFEAWARSPKGCGRLWRNNRPDTDIGGYQDSHTDFCWRSFNSAFDLILIVLPEPVTDNPDPLREFAYAQKCRAAIEQTGLGLRVK